MINIFYPGHSSHLDGKFSEAELAEGVKYLQEHHPRPPFTNSRIVVLNEPGPLTCTVSDDGQYPTPKMRDTRRAEMLEFDRAYCEQWRVERIKEMTDYLLKRREAKPSPAA